MWYIQYEYTAPGTLQKSSSEIPLDSESLDSRDRALKEAQKWLQEKGKAVRGLSGTFLVWKEPIE